MLILQLRKNVHKPTILCKSHLRILLRILFLMGFFMRNLNRNKTFFRIISNVLNNLDILRDTCWTKLRKKSVNNIHYFHHENSINFVRWWTYRNKKIIWQVDRSLLGLKITLKHFKVTIRKYMSSNIFHLNFSTQQKVEKIKVAKIFLHIFYILFENFHLISKVLQWIISTAIQDLIVIKIQNNINF